METPRIMVIGSKVTTVQSVSSYCLKYNFEVFPYYGTPLVEEITLFAPHALVLCLPICDDFQAQVVQPYILWSEQPSSGKSLLVSTATELYTSLQKVLAA
ncbi:MULTISPECIES: hypothetical protein [unclassified Nostoc]|uniref:hypothetical protein n=1 Tax=unclassified Nostoc TaxID=2593658 RepID=UPI001F548910|nr:MULTISPECIES: hypothetical protein [unclassified Nostoc]